MTSSEFGAGKEVLCVGFFEGPVVGLEVVGLDEGRELDGVEVGFEVEGDSVGVDVIGLPVGFNVEIVGL